MPRHGHQTVSGSRVPSRARGSSAGRRSGGLRPLNQLEHARLRFPCFAGFSIDASTRRNAVAAAWRATGGASRARCAPPDPCREPSAHQARPSRVLGPPARCARRPWVDCEPPNPAALAASARPTTLTPGAPQLAQLAGRACRGASAGLDTGTNLTAVCGCRVAQVILLPVNAHHVTALTAGERNN